MNCLDEKKRQIANYEASKITRDEYAAAVCLLAGAAQTDTGGGRAAAGVLLSAYNSAHYALDLSDLCVLDIAHYRAAIAVIRGRVELGTYPNDMIAGGDAIFDAIWDRWECLSIANRAKKLGA